MSKTFIHPYMPNSAPGNRQAMLDALGIREVEELYGQSIPQELLYRGTMNIPKPIVSEYALQQHVHQILSRNETCDDYDSYLGAGCYNHYVPAICDEINSRSEFLTGYCGDTYSDHGKMQAIFEYTSMLGELLDMDIVSYTLYDGGQAVTSGLRMTIRLQAKEGHPERKDLLVPATMSPEILSQIKDYCKSVANIVPVACDPKSGRMDLNDLKTKLETGTAASVYIENPSYLGFWEEQAQQIADARMQMSAQGAAERRRKT